MPIPTIDPDSVPDVQLFHEGLPLEPVTPDVSDSEFFDQDVAATPTFTRIRSDLISGLTPETQRRIAQLRLEREEELKEKKRKPKKMI